MLDENGAFEVIHLVLNTHGKQPFGVELEGFTVRIQGAHADMLRAGDLVVNAGHRKAPFFTNLLAVDVRRISGLISARRRLLSSETSITITRLCTST